MMDWLDLLAVQRTLKSLFQHHSSKASILRCLAFLIVQLSHPYTATGKPRALTTWTFVGKVMSLLFNMLSIFVIALLQRSKCRLTSWLQSPSVVILEPKKIKSVIVSKIGRASGRERVETVTDLNFGGSKITAYSDCSHEIKRHLLLGRKAITNLDSILKSETLLCQQRSI